MPAVPAKVEEFSTGCRRLYWLGYRTMARTVGVAGLGIMGGSFARHLLAEGFDVIGFDIVEANNRSFEADGGRVSISPRRMAESAEVIVTSLPSAKALREVISGQGGIADAKSHGLIVVEASTLPLADKLENRLALKAAGGSMLDCPVSGNGERARSRDITTYASGDENTFESARSVMEAYSRRVFHVGAFGDGSKIKFVVNHLVHIYNVAAAEAMVLGMKAGLDRQLLYNMISQGSGNSRVFEIRGRLMADDRYDQPTMKLDLWQKDMNAIREFASGVSSPIPVFEACLPIYESAISKGMGGLDTAAVCKIMEDMAGLTGRVDT